MGRAWHRHQGQYIPGLREWGWCPCKWTWATSQEGHLGTGEDSMRDWPVGRRLSLDRFVGDRQEHKWCHRHPNFPQAAVLRHFPHDEDPWMSHVPGEMRPPVSTCVRPLRVTTSTIAQLSEGTAYPSCKCRSVTTRDEQSNSL